MIREGVWTNAVDSAGVVHRVISHLGIMYMCTARCGLEGVWSHRETRQWAFLLVAMTWTDDAPSCMTCIVKEAERAPS